MDAEITKRQIEVTAKKNLFDLEEIDKRLSLLLDMRAQRDLLKKELYQNQVEIDAIELSITDDLLQADDHRIRNSKGLFSVKTKVFLTIKDEEAGLAWLRENQPDLVENKDVIKEDDLSIYLAEREISGEEPVEWATVFQKPTIRHTPAK
jgi:hypothetical protein